MYIVYAETQVIITVMVYIIEVTWLQANLCSCPQVVLILKYMLANVTFRPCRNSSENVLYCISSTQVSSALSVSLHNDGSVYSPCDECSCLCFTSAKPLTRGIC